MPQFNHPGDCVACPRLASHLQDLRQQHPDWHSRPVPSFGDLNASFLVVGLAPGEKGANRTGRPFTGDVAGELLYPALHRYGFASHDTPLDASAWANPDMRLKDCRITNAVRCLPPENKPTTAEIKQCNSYLGDEIKVMDKLLCLLALGAIAHQAVLRAFELKVKDYVFGHGKVHELPGGLRLFDSYHCSGYNWRTGRLTRESFESVFAAIRQYLDQPR